MKKLTSVPDETEEKISLMEKDILLNKMMNAINTVKHRTATMCKFVLSEKKSYAEIAEITGFTMLQVKSHIQNGKRNLKLMMD